MSTPTELWEEGKATEAFNAAMQERDQRDIALTALETELAALRARVAELEQDEARLDWLDLHISTQETSDILGVAYSNCHLIRAAIDAARTNSTTNH